MKIEIEVGVLADTLQEAAELARRTHDVVFVYADERGIRAVPGSALPDPGMLLLALDGLARWSFDDD